MSEDLIKLQRIRDIPDNAVTQIDNTTFEIESSNTRNQGEVIYSVIYSQKLDNWWCSCKDFLFRNTEETPDYECKHIGKVRELLYRRIQK